MATETTTEEDVYEALEEVIDPELGLDFVSLGLVYDVEIEGPEAYITFTLTTPALPDRAAGLRADARVRGPAAGDRQGPSEDGLRSALVPGDDVRGREVRPRVLTSRQAMMRRGTAIGVSAILALTGLAAAAPAGLAPARAKAATEYDSLVAYWPAGKLKVGKRISYRFVCANDCQVTATSTLVLPGRNLGPVVDTGDLLRGPDRPETLTLNKAARFAIASHLRQPPSCAPRSPRPTPRVRRTATRASSASGASARPNLFANG